MQSFSTHHGRSATKLCLIGDSGSGKSGALAALVNEGWKLAICDFDNGLDILWEYTDPACLDNIVYETYVDTVRVVGNKAIPVKVEALEKSTKFMDQVIKGDLPNDWPKEKFILVIDSGTHWGEACLRFAQKMNPGSTKWESYGGAMEIQEGYLNALHGIPWLNLIITWHKSPFDLDPGSGLSQFYPSALGKKLPPKIGTYFNNMIAVESRGSGDKVERYIRTVSGKQLELKSSAPRSVPAEIPMGVDKNNRAVRGLAEFFKLVQSPPEKETTQ